MRYLRYLAPVLLLVSIAAFGQIASAPRPTVTVAPGPSLTIAKGKAATFELVFRVAPGFHVNSNKPKDEYLIPTTLKLEIPSDMMVSHVAYPEGQDRSFDFSPTEKINVYTGDFAINGILKIMRTASTGRYRLHGVLTYQACDHAACYPPKRLPVQFDVKVVKGATKAVHKNPGQSPNIH